MWSIQSLYYYTVILCKMWSRSKCGYQFCARRRYQHGPDYLAARQGEGLASKLGRRVMTTVESDSCQVSSRGFDVVEGG
jgi:hypothetical protein